MIKAVLLVVSLLSVAQAFPSCGGEPEPVIGYVEAKGYDRASNAYTLTILGTEYEITWAFFQEVKVGDLVKWDGKTWTIIKKASMIPLAMR